MERNYQKNINQKEKWKKILKTLSDHTKASSMARLIVGAFLYEGITGLYGLVPLLEVRT